jgi:hypothetical protein
MQHLGESVKNYASEYSRLVPEEWRKTLNLPPPPTHTHTLTTLPPGERGRPVVEVEEVSEEDVMGEDLF